MRNNLSLVLSCEWLNFNKRLTFLTSGQLRILNYRMVEKIWFQPTNDIHSLFGNDTNKSRLSTEKSFVTKSERLSNLVTVV